jgi:hypothetical protein
VRPPVCGRVLGIAVALASTSTAAHGQATRHRVPTLADHRFVEAPLMRMPFVRSTVKMGLGVGGSGELDYGTVTLPEGDTLVALRGELLVAAVSFEYAYAVREWLGVYGEFTLKGRTGSDGPSLVETGVTYGTSFEVGWLAHIAETERTLVSGSFYLANRDVAQIDPLGFLVDIAQGNPPELLTTTPSLRVGLSGHFAHAFNSIVGTYASGTASFGESLRDRETEWLFGIVAGLSLDFEPKRVPVGLAVTVRADDDASALGSASGPWEALGLRVTYTEPTDMQLSVVSSFSRVPFTESRDMTIAEIGVEMRYFFF